MLQGSTVTVTIDTADFGPRSYAVTIREHLDGGYQAVAITPGGFMLASSPAGTRAEVVADMSARIWDHVGAEATHIAPVPAEAPIPFGVPTRALCQGGCRWAFVRPVVFTDAPKHHDDGMVTLTLGADL